MGLFSSSSKSFSTAIDSRAVTDAQGLNVTGNTNPVVARDEGTAFTVGYLGGNLAISDKDAIRQAFDFATKTRESTAAQLNKVFDGAVGLLEKAGDESTPAQDERKKLVIFGAVALGVLALWVIKK